MGRKDCSLLWHRLASTTVVLLLHSLLIAFALSAVAWPADEQTDQGVMPHLLETWSVRRTEVATCDINYRFVILHIHLDEKQTTAEQFHHLLDTYDLGNHPDRLPQFLQEITDDPPRRYPRGVPSRFVLFGDQRFYQQGTVTSIFDGRFELHADDDNQQVAIGYPGQTRRGMARLQHFRDIPTAGISPDDMVVEQVVNGVAKLRGTKSADSKNVRPYEVQVDMETGILLNRRSFWPDSNTILRESIERDIIEYAGGIPMPVLRIEARYRSSGHLQNVTIRMIEQARFNEDVSLSLFKLARPKGTTIVDYRSGTKLAYRLKHDTDDVASLSPGLPAPVIGAGAVPVKDRHGGVLRWLLILNGLFLFGLGIWLWRREREKRSRTTEGSN